MVPLSGLHFPKLMVTQSLSNCLGKLRVFFPLETLHQVSLEGPAEKALAPSLRTGQAFFSARFPVCEYSKNSSATEAPFSGPQVPFLISFPNSEWTLSPGPPAADTWTEQRREPLWEIPPTTRS